MASNADLFMHPNSQSCIIEEVEEDDNLSSSRPQADLQQAPSSCQAEQQDAPEQAVEPPGSEQGDEQLQQVINECERFKQEGNALYAQEDWDGALQLYWQAIDHAPEDAQERAVYFCNAAACYLKQQAWQLAVEQCTQALKLNNSYLKALVRRATALQEMDDLEHAVADAQRVLELDAQNAWAARKVAELTPLVQERQEKMKEEMLGKLKDLGNTILGKFGMSLDNFKAEKDPETGSYSIKFNQ